MKPATYTTTLTEAECKALEKLLRGYEWWECREILDGITHDIAKRAMKGEPILHQTADRIRKALKEWGV